jgi:hypothetical protein
MIYLYLFGYVSWLWSNYLYAKESSYQLNWLSLIVIGALYPVILTAILINKFRRL